MSIEKRLIKIEQDIDLLLNPPETPEQKRAREYKEKWMKAFVTIAGTMREDHRLQMGNEILTYLKARKSGDARKAFFAMSLMSREVKWQIEAHMKGHESPLAMPEAYALFLFKCESQGLDMKEHVKCLKCRAWYPAIRKPLFEGKPFTYVECEIDLCPICGGAIKDGYFPYELAQQVYGERQVTKIVHS